MLRGAFGGKKPAHYLVYDYRRGLKDLIVGSAGTGDAEMGAELIFYRAAYFVAGNFSDHGYTSG